MFSLDKGLCLMNSKAKGNRIERECIALLTHAGFHCCRSSASLGMFDVLGISAEYTIAVQCKANRWTPKKERLVIEGFQCPTNCIKLDWRRDDRKNPRIRLFKAGFDGDLLTVPGLGELIASGALVVSQCGKA